MISGTWNSFLVMVCARVGQETKKVTIPLSAGMDIDIKG